MKNPPAILERSKHGEISCNMVHNAHKQIDYLASRVAICEESWSQPLPHLDKKKRKKKSQFCCKTMSFAK